MLAAEHESVRHCDWKQLALEDRHCTRTAHGTPGVRDATLLSYQLTAVPHYYACGRHVTIIFPQIHQCFETAQTCETPPGRLNVLHGPKPNRKAFPGLGPDRRGIGRHFGFVHW